MILAFFPHETRGSWMEFKNTTRSEMNKEVCLPHPGVKIAAGGTCRRQPATMTEAPTNTCCFISKGSFLVIRWFWKGGHVLSTILWPRSWLKLTKSLWHYRRALEKYRKKKPLASVDRWIIARMEVDCPCGW